jgi:hypothetical protein
LSFDGVNDWVTVLDGAAGSPLDLTTALTIAAWVNPAAFDGWETLVIKERGPGALSYGLWAHDSAAGPVGVLSAGGDQELHGANVLPTGVWTHVALTWDGATARLYVNGVQAASRALAGPIAAGNQPLRIGGGASFAGEFFEGRIDEVRLYNRALTAAEILSSLITP